MPCTSDLRWCLPDELGKERTLKVRFDLWRRITAARRARGLPEEPGSGGNEPLFPNRWGRPCSVTYPRRLVGQAARAAGVAKPVSPHWFRHSHATLTLAGEAPVLQVQHDLGLASLAMTQRYLHLAQGLREGSSTSSASPSPGSSAARGRVWAGARAACVPG